MAFPWGALISAGGSLLGGGVSAFGARGMSQRDAMDFQRVVQQEATAWNLLNGPRLEMEGLRAAGINPMLRYGHGGSAVPMGATAVSIPQPSNRLEHLGAGIAGAGSSAVSAHREQAQAGLSQAEAESIVVKLPAELAKLEADTSLSQAQRKNARAEYGRILQETLLAHAHEELAKAQAAGVPAQIAQAMAHVQLLGAQTETEWYRQHLTKWEAALRGVEAYLADLQYSRAASTAEVFEGAYGQFLRYLGETTGAIGNIFGQSGQAVNLFR